MNPVQLKRNLTELERAVRYATGEPLIIAGGFARDLYFNREPRDADVWIPSGIGKDMETQLAECLYDVGFNYVELGVEDVASMTAENDERVKFVMKDEEMGIDVIFSSKPTATDIVMSFDCTLNMALWSTSTDQVIWLDHDTKQWSESTDRKFKFIRPLDELKVTRIHYMLELAAELDWEILI